MIVLFPPFSLILKKQQMSKDSFLFENSSSKVFILQHLDSNKKSTKGVKETNKLILNWTKCDRNSIDIKQDFPGINFLNATKIKAAELLDVVAILCTLIQLPHIYQY